MPTFKYTAKSFSGEQKSGTLDANSEVELAGILREQGLVLTSIQDNKKKASFNKFADFVPNLFSRVPLAEKMIFAKNLSVMIGAGLSLNRALDALSQQTKNKAFQKVLQEISDDIKKGTTFADGLSKHPKIFSELFINMVKIGETSGGLENILVLLANQMEKEHNLKSKVKGAMIYPSVVVVVMIGIGVAMMTLVVPKLLTVFKEMGTELPLSTKILIATSDFLSAHLIMGSVIVLAVVFGFRFLARTKVGIFYLDKLLLHAPIFGNISRKVNSAMFARTLGSLVEGSVPIVQGLTIVSGTMTNCHFKDSLSVAATEVQKGLRLSEALKAYANLYPPMVYQMIEVGEETGSLGSILIRLAEFYENEVNDISKNMASIIEPVLMVIIGSVIGLFAISMIQPLYSVMGNM